MNVQSASGSERAGQGRLRRLLLGMALCGATVLLAWAAFPPADRGFLAWIALVPWLVLIGRERPLKAGLWSLALGWVFFLLTIHWIRFVTPPGWVALAFYCGVYWAAAGMGIAWLRSRRIPLLISAPLLITALELVRARLLTGFPFIFLGHTQYGYLPVIQIADFAGVYGITFLIVLVNAVIVEGILSWRTRRVLVLAGAAAAVALVLGSVAYGMARIKAYQPRGQVSVLLVQANVSQDLKHSISYADLEKMLQDHTTLTLQAQARPDVILWPETMFPAPFNVIQDPEVILRYVAYSNPELPPERRAEVEKNTREYGRYLERCRENFLQFAQRADAPLLIGAPTDEGPAGRRYNSAYLLTPQGKELARYDKIHLVIFGEYTPLTELFPFLKGLRPPEMGGDLYSGTQRTIMSLPLRHGGAALFGVTICYEDADADLFRRFVHDGAEFMVNLTNDGWFQNSSELDQHLAVSVFRAVENRISLARNANTGVSAIIDPVGRMQTLVSSDGRRRGVKGVLLGNVALTNLRSAYTANGDIFGFGALIASGLLLFVGALRRPVSASDTPAP